MSFPEETVVVRHHEPTGETDAYGAPITETVEETVEGVLVAPGADADLGEDRPAGVEVAWTLYFPKAYAADLERADVEVRGEWCRVIGKPGAYDPSFCPTDWNRKVNVEAIHG